MLWFDPVSDRNFFYTFLESAKFRIVSVGGDNDSGYRISPQFIGAYLGASDKDYTLVYPDTNVVDYNKVYETGLEVAKKAVAEGEAVEVGADMQVTWSQPNIFYNYGFPLTKDILQSTLSFEISQMDKLERIDGIGIIPGTDLEQSVLVYIVGGDRIAVYELEKSAVKQENDALNNYLDLLGSASSVGYVSTAKNDIDFFNHNVIIPLPGELLVYERGLRLKPAFIVEGAFQMEILEDFVDGFLVNPAVKWTIENTDTIQYGDDKALIAYSKDGVFEYNSVKSADTRQVSFGETLDVAAQFITRDEGLALQDYVLAGYEEEDGVTVFFYSYLYNNIPLNFDEGYLEGLGLVAPMEVRVSKGQVIQYKRLVMEHISRVMGMAALNSRFETTLDRFLDMKPVVAGELQDMYLAYDVMGDGTTEIAWVIEYQNQKMSLPLD